MQMYLLEDTLKVQPSISSIPIQLHPVRTVHEGGIDRWAIKPIHSLEAASVFHGDESDVSRSRRTCEESDCQLNIRVLNGKQLTNPMRL
jgi:hypothetical protein